MNEKALYVAEAAEHGRCTESGDFKRGNAAVDRMKAVLAKLRGHADRGESVLTELLTHQNGWVKLWAATHLLPLRAELACKILEDLESGPRSETEYGARMVLREWRAGRLNVP
jgi:hypothetical protein